MKKNDTSLPWNTEGLEETVGYRFKDKTLLETAMTHSSFSNESKARNVVAPCNERLEFLGDAVLQIIISEYLFSRYAQEPEGYLTQIRQHLVCEGTLAAIARKIQLGMYIRFGRGEELMRGRERASILADATEALLGAVYLDGGKGAAEKLLMSLMREELETCTRSRGGDYKTRLQQLVQQDGNETLSYEVVAEEGPDHDRIYEVVAKINSNEVGRGRGRSKREAEQQAAKKALEFFAVDSTH